MSLNRFFGATSGVGRHRLYVGTTTWYAGTSAPEFHAIKPSPWHHPNGGFLQLGVPFGGPHNKDYNILGSRLGSPILGNYQMS